MKQAITEEEKEYRAGDLEDIWVWVGLLVCLALTVWVSYANWGAWSTALSFAISAIKTVLVAYFYMHLRNEKGMTRIFAIAGIAWLFIFITITFSDYMSRGWLAEPARWPIFVKLRPGLNEVYGPDQEQAPRPGGFGVGR